MLNLLTIDKIPNCRNIPRIGQISAGEIFPAVSFVESDPVFHVHSDGSIYQLFEIQGFNIRYVDDITRHLPCDAACQIYKVRGNGENKHYYSLCKKIDYSFLKPSLTNIPLHLFKGLSGISDELNSVTKRNIKRLAKCLIPGSHSSGFKNNALVRSLADCHIDDKGFHLNYPIKTNLSLLLTGKKRFSAVISLGNLDYMPAVCNLLDDFDYTLCISIIKPDEQQQLQLRNASFSLKKLISKLSSPKTPSTWSHPRVDTTMVSNGDLQSMINDTCFINANYIISCKNSADGLNEEVNKFVSRLNGQMCFTYNHTISARFQYISLFPGNACYGSYFQLVNSSFLFTACRKILSV